MQQQKKGLSGTGCLCLTRRLSQVKWRPQMSMDLRLSQRVALQQHMTPQLAFLMHLLARPWQELRQELVQAVTDNPALEEVLEMEDVSGAAPEEEVAAPDSDAGPPHFPTAQATLLDQR